MQPHLAVRCEPMFTYLFFVWIPCCCSKKLTGPDWIIADQTAEIWAMGNAKCILVTLSVFYNKVYNLEAEGLSIERAGSFPTRQFYSHPVTDFMRNSDQHWLGPFDYDLSGTTPSLGWSWMCTHIYNFIHTAVASHLPECMLPTDFIGRVKTPDSWSTIINQCIPY